MPWETYEGFRVLGYGLILSFFGTAVVHLFLSYWTLDSWVPDPFFPILVKNVDRLKHGSDSQLYNHNGTLKQVSEPQKEGEEPMINFLKQKAFPRNYTRGSISLQENAKGLSFTQLWKWTQLNWDIFDVFGFFANKVEWFYLWILCQNNGTLHWEDMRDQYDGTLFERIERKRKPVGLGIPNSDE